MDKREIMPGLVRIPLPIPRGGFESFINGYLICDRRRGRTILMETGPACSVPQLARDLHELGADKIDYLIYTHIHLDHAGGVGQFHKLFPQTKVIAPRRGRAHLVDPSKLLAGSRVTIGGLCDVYGAPEPLPQEALAPEDLVLDGLTVIETPGHAPHHDSYIYELDGKRLLFAGEAAGCCFTLPDGGIFIRPATPDKFFYEVSMESLDKLLALKDIDLVCYPHAAAARDWRRCLEAAREQMELWKDIILALPAEATAEDAFQAVMAHDPALKELSRLPENERRRELYFLRQSAKGYLGWKQRNREADSGSPSHD